MLVDEGLDRVGCLLGAQLLRHDRRVETDCAATADEGRSGRGPADRSKPLGDRLLLRGCHAGDRMLPDHAASLASQGERIPCRIRRGASGPDVLNDESQLKNQEQRTECREERSHEVGDGSLAKPRT